LTQKARASRKGMGDSSVEELVGLIFKPHPSRQQLG
jgi:hypothetical protein